MNIKAKITGIKYKPKCISDLDMFDFSNFDINKLPASCIVNYGDFTFGLSKWVSPKRTRSYPYERIYNTLGTAKRITIIPIIKDEGKKGDRDFIQWDTISLMSLLDIFIVFTYYIKAEKHPTREDKVTNQQFDNDLIKAKIMEIKIYHSSALHWNLKEIEKSFLNLIQKVQSSYNEISKKLNVEFHNKQGIEKFSNQFIDGVKHFIRSSRQKAKDAQNREIKTIQPKEFLSSLTKTKITIENYLGGKYYFTTDEIKIEENKIFLIEGKHSKTSLLPSTADIKDALLKMILYTNLRKVFIEGKEYQVIPIIKLTSSKLLNKKIQIDHFLNSKELTEKQKNTVKKLLEESKENNFSIVIENVKLNG